MYVWILYLSYSAREPQYSNWKSVGETGLINYFSEVFCPVEENEAKIFINKETLRSGLIELSGTASRHCFTATKNVITGTLLMG